ncbi:hypothetical protein GALMADRAFT_145416, partial [Galerina marginata CBS 339.88]
EPAAESSTPVSPVLSASSDHPASDKPPTSNGAAVTTGANFGKSVASTAKKTKKGGPNTKAATATRKVPAAATSGGSEASTSRAPTRSSKRATDLKRKQSDTTSTADAHPQPAKKRRVKERWEWAT